MKLDEIDYQIIEMLQTGERMSNNEIASRLSVTEGTVRNRIKKLTGGGFLSVRGLINPDKFHDRQLIFLGLTIAGSKDLETVSRRLSDLPSVRSVCVVSGRYDLIIEVFIEPHKLVNFLSSQLASINSVTSTESFICLESRSKWI